MAGSAAASTGGSALDVAQVVLSALDTSFSRQWREEDRIWRREDRAWREEDMSFRKEERAAMEEERRMRDMEVRWRDEDMEQCHVDNARYLWTRFVERNRRDVEEKSEQLKAISNLAALFAGFALVTLTQFSYDETATNIIWIFFYGLSTAVSVGLMIISMVSCTLILGSILKNGKTYVNEKVEEQFMLECHEFVKNYNQGDHPPIPTRTFEKFWENRCEEDWRRAFQIFSWGVLSFLLSLIPIGWIKFGDSPLTSSLFSGVTIISIIGWGASQYYWGNYLTSLTNKEQLESCTISNVIPVGLPFDWHITHGSIAVREIIDGQ